MMAKIWIQNVGEEGAPPIEIWAMVGDGAAQCGELLATLPVGMMHEARLDAGESLRVIESAQEGQTENWQRGSD
jgi:hypothetical protein